MRSWRGKNPAAAVSPYKAYNQYPFLIDNSTPKRFVTESVLAAPNAGEASLRLDDPLLIYSRIELNRMLLDRAEKAGAQLEKARVLEMERSRVAGLAAAHEDRHRGSGFLHRRHRRAQSAARCGHATDAAGYHVRARLLRAGRADAHRHPVSAAPRRLHLDLPALRPHVGGDLRQGRTGQFAAATPGALHDGTRSGMEGLAVLQPSAAFARDRLVAQESRRRRRMDGGGRRGGLGGSDHRRGSSITPFARPIWRRARCFRK